PLHLFERRVQYSTAMLSLTRTVACPAKFPAQAIRARFDEGCQILRSSRAYPNMGWGMCGGGDGLGAAEVPRQEGLAAEGVGAGEELEVGVVLLAPGHVAIEGGVLDAKVVRRRVLLGLRAVPGIGRGARREARGERRLEQPDLREEFGMSVGRGRGAQ